MPKFKGAIWDSFDALCSKIITSKIPTSASFSTGMEALKLFWMWVLRERGGGHRETETDRQTDRKNDRDSHR